MKELTKLKGFTTLVISATGEVGRECKKFNSCLAEMKYLKRGYNITYKIDRNLLKW